MDQKSSGMTSSNSNDAATQGRKSSGTVRLGAAQDASTIDQAVSMVVCPVCHFRSHESDTYCAECGFQLGSDLESDASLSAMEETERFPHLEDESGHTFPLKPGVNTIGRESTDVLLVDRSVSRYHGIIVYDEERNLFSVEDSGSTNGSLLNGELLAAHEPRAIHSNDYLDFGNIAVRFVVKGKPQPEVHVPHSEEQSETTVPNGADPDSLTAEPAGRLDLLRGSAPREFMLNQGINTIGRLNDNGLCLTEDRYVSGHHARIDVDGDLFLLLDMGSTNGTFLNGLRLTTNAAIAISDGDEITIGGLLFQFHRNGARQASDPLERTLLGAPSLDHLSAAVIGKEAPAPE